MKTKITQTLRSAVQKLGVLAVGEELSDNEYRDCLVALNRVVDNYHTNGIFIGSTQDIVLSAPTGGWKGSVSFGKNCDYDEIRPTEFVSLAFRESGNTEYPLKEMSNNEYMEISVKNTVAIPSKFLYDFKRGDIGLLNFDCIPQDGLELVGLTKVRYTGTTSQGAPLNSSDEVDWDDGIEAMIVYRTAIELAPDYGVRDIGTIASLLDDIEGKVIRRNAPEYTMEVEDSMRSPYVGERYNRARY